MAALRAVVVDDNRHNREIVATVLQARDLQTAMAETAEQGWKIAKLTAPHLIVIDIMLPGEMDGVQLCKKLRGEPEFGDAIIVMVTAADRRKQAERSIAAGADVLIPKPFTPSEFWRQVDQLIKSRFDKKPRHRVFILDDDHTDIDIARQALESEGYAVAHTDQVSGAILEIKNFRPDLVLLDVMMPELSGHDLARIISRDKNLVSKPKIVFYSNKSADELAKLCEQSGVAGYVCKFQGPGKLLETLKGMLAGR